MKTLIFSDTHLTAELDQPLFKKLVEVISQVDQVIINGDFIEGYVVGAEKFVNSGWRLLFPLLKKKNTVFIYGNHDRKEMVGDWPKLFSSQQTTKFSFNFDNKEIIVTHGHLIAPEFDATFPRITARFRQHYHIFFDLHRSRAFSGRLYSYIKGYHYRAMMRKIWRYALTELKENQLLISGHSHQALDDRENGFINVGAFQQGVANYVIVDDAGKGSIKIFQEQYE